MMTYSTETLIDKWMREPSAFDIGRRNDGKFNIWRKGADLSVPKEDATWFYEVVAVVSTFKNGVELIDWMLKNRAFTKDDIDSYVSERGFA